MFVLLMQLTLLGNSVIIACSVYNNNTVYGIHKYVLLCRNALMDCTDVLSNNVRLLLSHLIK